jgi:protein-disulfide isomerase
MNRKRGWLAALSIVVLLVVACGPTMTTPTSPSSSDTGGTPTTASAAPTPSSAPAANTPTAAAVAPTQAPTAEAVSPGDLPVSADDWHVLGPADAKVTIIEYSDFQ